MNFWISLIVIAFIIGLAAHQIVRTVQRSKKGKCAACDYECEAKKMMEKNRKQAL